MSLYSARHPRINLRDQGSEDLSRLNLDSILDGDIPIELPWPAAWRLLDPSPLPSDESDGSTEIVFHSFFSSVETRRIDNREDAEVISDLDFPTRQRLDRSVSPTNSTQAAAEMKRRVNCWRGFVRREMMLKDNKRLRLNINQTYFRGLKDTIKHLESQANYDFSAKFIGTGYKTKADKAARKAFNRGVKPYVAEAFQHLNKNQFYTQSNISFSQTERSKVLEMDSALRAYVHYSAFVFYNLRPKRLAKKFNVFYVGDEPLDQVWLSVKAYYSFGMLVDELGIKEADILRVMHEDGLIDQFADALEVYRAS
jgi:hypothetical protein